MKWSSLEREGKVKGKRGRNLQARSHPQEQPGRRSTSHGVTATGQVTTELTIHGEMEPHRGLVNSLCPRRGSTPSGQGSGGEHQPVLWLTFTSRSKGVRWGLVAQPYLGGTIHILSIRASIPPGSLPAPALVPALPSPQPEQMKPLTQTNYYPEPLPSFFLIGLYFLFGGFCAVKQVHRPFVSGMAMRFWLRCAWR